MSHEYELHEEEITPPKGAGIPGLLRAVSEILRLDRVQEVRVKATGKIEYDFYLRKGEAERKLIVNFEKVMPLAIARNAIIEELPYPSGHAAVAIAQMFGLSSKEHMSPIAFIGHEGSAFWPWYNETAGVTPDTKEDLFGLPFLTDPAMEVEALLLCTGYKRNGLITDTVKSFKIAIPKVRR